MTSFLILAYAIVAFIAGIVALAMPCCFSVLLPSYFAQSFNSKTRRLGMSVIFSAGIATIMLPIALGALVVSQTIAAHHDLVFTAGGFLMIALGAWTLWGKGMLPQLNLPVNLKRTDIPSVYTLGIFSGAATTCCAPVLAGVLVLTALSTSPFEALLIGFTYVAGMVFPLLMIAMFWDKYATSGTNPFRGRIVYLSVMKHEFGVHSSKLIAGLMFISMGIVTVGLGVTGTMIPMPGTALVAVLEAGVQASIVGFFSDNLWAGITTLAIAGLTASAFIFRARSHHASATAALEAEQDGTRPSQKS